MTQTINLADDVMARAGQWFFASEWASAHSAAGFRFPPRTEITDVCPPQDKDKLVGLVRPYVARLARSWGMGVGEMFGLMEIPEDKWADALYLVLMSCRGNGIGLADDYDANISTAEDKLGRGIDPSPFDDEFMDFYMLASDVVEAEARKPDDKPGPDAPLHPGDRVRVEARMPTGDVVTGKGTVVRWVAEGDDRSPSDGVTVTMDDDESVDPWCYRDVAIFVESDDCKLLADGERASAVRS